MVKKLIPINEILPGNFPDFKPEDRILKREDLKKVPIQILFFAMKHGAWPLVSYAKIPQSREQWSEYFKESVEFGWDCLAGPGRTSFIEDEMELRLKAYGSLTGDRTWA